MLSDVTSHEPSFAVTTFFSLTLVHTLPGFNCVMLNVWENATSQKSWGQGKICSDVWNEQRNF